jgi:hypothetical protein
MAENYKNTQVSQQSLFDFDAPAPPDEIKPIVPAVNYVITSTPTVVLSEAFVPVENNQSQKISSDKPSLASPSKSIVDAGEELTYNRRNRIKANRQWLDISSLNDALKVKETNKHAIWPKPDYDEMIEGGMDPKTAYIVKHVYDSVSSKPLFLRTEKIDDETLQRYFKSVERIRDGISAWSNSLDAVSQFFSKQANRAGTLIGRRVDLDVSGPDLSILSVIYPDGWRNYKMEIMTAGNNKLLGGLQPGTNEMIKAVKEIDGGWPSKKESWQKQGYSIMENPVIEAHKSPYSEGVFFISVNDKSFNRFDSLHEAEDFAALIKPFVLIYKNHKIESSFDTEQDAIECARDKVKRERAKTIDDKGISVQEAVRVGPDHRPLNEDITAEQLREEFGFKGINFGNWMKTASARQEAQLHLNHAFDALHDLATILHVSPKFIGLGGMLGLAIGAQGSGGKNAAHFVPGVNEINLTRASGAGSLGHEWAHAFDSFVAAQAGLSTSSSPYLTEHAKGTVTRSEYTTVNNKVVTTEVPRFGSLDLAVANSFSDVVAAMNLRPQTLEEVAQMNESYSSNTKSRLSRQLESFKRQFLHLGSEPEFTILANRILAGDFGEGLIKASSQAQISPVVVEIRDLYKQKTKRLYPLDDIKLLQSTINSLVYDLKSKNKEITLKPSSVKTTFASDAYALDKEKGGTPYWSTNLEKFARSFDAWISDELELKGMKNTYLSHAGRVGKTVPSGADRVAINAALCVVVKQLPILES